MPVVEDGVSRSPDFQTVCLGTGRQFSGPVVRLPNVLHACPRPLTEKGNPKPLAGGAKGAVSGWGGPVLTRLADAIPPGCGGQDEAISRAQCVFRWWQQQQ